MTHDEMLMTQSQELAIEAVLVTKTYRASMGRNSGSALAQFDLSVEPGKCLMLVGPNGAGKSTALRLLAGVERPDSGRVRIYGDPPGTVKNRLRIGYLPDASPLFPFLDVYETLDFFGAAANVPRKERKSRAEELIDRFEMGAWKKKRAGKYSLGMRRRLALSSVLIGQPDVLLLDEPTGGLDPQSTRAFLDCCRELKSAGTTIVMTSHHLGHMESLCDDVLVLKEGRVAFSGEVTSLEQRIGRCALDLDAMTEEQASALEAFLKEAGIQRHATHVSERGLEDFLLGENS